MTDPFIGLGFELDGPRFSLRADGRTYTPDNMTQKSDDHWFADGVDIRLEAGRTEDGSRSLVLVADGVTRVNEVCLLDHTISPAPAEIHNHRWRDWPGPDSSTAVFVRAAPGGGPRQGGGPDGFFACYASPFGQAQIGPDHLRLSYRPDMDVAGTFRSDPLVVGPYTADGRRVARRIVPGRDTAKGKVAGFGLQLGTLAAGLDRGEIAAVRRAVAARMPWEGRARIAHWDWAENTYRLQMTDDSPIWAIYERLFDLCHQLGVETVLLSPSREKRDWLDGGPWQHIMFLGLGLEVAVRDWPGPEESVSGRLVAMARDGGVVPVGYSNPQALTPNRQDWLLKAIDPERYGGTCLAVPEARAEVIAEMQAFRQAYGLGGFSLDFIGFGECHAEGHGHEIGPGSIYAQWAGLLEVFAALHAVDDAWVEWLIGAPPALPWAAATVVHPHPVLGDNSPQWVPAWPDLSLDRANGNFQRRTAYWMRNFAFLPSYKVPGQVSHQNDRRHDFPFERGWDWEGARYNLLSSIASGPSTTSICFFPCWDEGEWAGMLERDGEFYRRWLAFARDNAAVLSRLEDLFDEPCPGTVDGTMALPEDEPVGGFVFLANPDYTAHEVEVPTPEGCLLRELHPHEGRLWERDVEVDPHEVAVLEVVARPDSPVVVGVAAEVDTAGNIVSAAGTPGTTRVARVVSARRGQRQAEREVPVTFESDGVTPTLGPWRDASGSPVDLATAEGPLVLSTDWVPGEALPGMLDALAPPIALAGHEALQPWSDPGRLRLYFDMVDASTSTVRCRVDGEDVPVERAWVGTFEEVTDPPFLEHNLLGHFVNLDDKLRTISDRTVPWHVEIEAEGDGPGFLRGVHVAHLPRRVTDVASWPAS